MIVFKCGMAWEIILQIYGESNNSMKFCWPRNDFIRFDINPLLELLLSLWRLLTLVLFWFILLGVGIKGAYLDFLKKLIFFVFIFYVENAWLRLLYFWLFSCMKDIGLKSDFFFIISLMFSNFYFFYYSVLIVNLATLPKFIPLSVLFWFSNFTLNFLVRFKYSEENPFFLTNSSSL